MQTSYELNFTKIKEYWLHINNYRKYYACLQETYVLNKAMPQINFYLIALNFSPKM